MALKILKPYTKSTRGTVLLTREVWKGNMQKAKKELNWENEQKKLNEIYSNHTGKPVSEIKVALERDNFMTVDNAKSFGLIDKVVDKRP